MAINKEKAMYFWHRHLEGADPETRTLRKWNAAYKEDLTTLDEINGFISGMEEMKLKLNISDMTAMQILCGEIDESNLIPTKPKLKVKRNINKKEV